MEKVVFKKSGVSADGDALYDLYIGGKLVREGLTMDEVVERICGSAEPDRNPPQIRTPEDRRGRLQRR